MGLPSFAEASEGKNWVCLGLFFGGNVIFGVKTM